MKRVTSAVVLCVLSALAVGGCKKDEPEPQAIPISSGAPAAVTADPAPTGTAAAAPMDTAAAGTSTAAAATPPATQGANTGTGTPAPTPKAGASIDACCSALRAVASSGKSALTKTKSAAAAAVCPGIASRVKAGETTRSAGLTQIKSALTGVSVPPECN